MVATLHECCLIDVYSYLQAGVASFFARQVLVTIGRNITKVCIYQGQLSLHVECSQYHRHQPTLTEQYYYYVLAVALIYTTRLA